MVRRIAITFLIAGGFSASAHAQGDNRPPIPTGSAQITGRVLASDNGQPVRRASLSLWGLPDSEINAGVNRVYVNRTVETDLNGSFIFRELPAGSYGIMVGASNGFVKLARPRDVLLAGKQTLKVVFRLARTGSIQGRIRDEHGDAVLGVHVEAIRRVSFSGLVKFVATNASAMTNDRGEFRIFNLPADDYVVVASQPMSRRDLALGANSGYADTYYPGSTSASDARAITVRAGRDKTGVNLTLRSTTLSTVRVYPLDSRGVALGNTAQLSLTKRGDVFLNTSTRSTSRRDDGTFEFADVAPGDYYLVVTKSVELEEAAYVNVTVNKEEVSVDVRTSPGAKVSGRVIVDGRPPGARGSKVSNVTISAWPPPDKYGPLYARTKLADVRDTDRFEVTGLRGPMRIWADAAGGTTVSIQRRGEEIGGKTLEFSGTEEIDDVIVSVTTQFAGVDVMVTSRRASVEPRPVLVVLFSESPAHWAAGYSRYDRTVAVGESTRRGRSQQSPAAKTRLSRLPPGRYLIAAIPDPDLSYPIDSRMLDKLRRLATPVTLVAGQTATITLRMIDGF